MGTPGQDSASRIRRRGRAPRRVFGTFIHFWHLIPLTWGQVGTNYTRVGRANYADGKNTQAGGPNPRYTSNRVFNDVGQNIFSERNVSQWGWTWGQFMDHVFGLAQDGTESTPIPTDQN